MFCCVDVVMLLQVLAGRSSQSSLNPFDLRAWRLDRQQNTPVSQVRKIMTWIVDFILCLDDNESKGQPGSIFVLGEHGFFFFYAVLLLGWTQLMDSGSDCLFPRAVATADWSQLRGKRANTPWGMKSLRQESCVMIIRPFLLFDIVDKHQQAARIHSQMSSFIIKKQRSSGNTVTVTKCILEWTSAVTGTFIRVATPHYLFRCSETQYNLLHHLRFHQTGTQEDSKVTWSSSDTAKSQLAFFSHCLWFWLQQKGYSWTLWSENNIRINSHPCSHKC